MLNKEICALHIHDNDFGIDMHMMMLFGRIDWSNFVKSLQEINFTGVFSLETEPPQKLPR